MSNVPVKVMLVDDDEVSNFITSESLKELDQEIEVITCHNGKEALDLLRNITDNSSDPAQELPDIIFLDVNMPVMNAFQFMEAYKEMGLADKKKIEIVLLLGTPLGDEEMAKARKYKKMITTYVEKPLNNVLVSNIVKSHVNPRENGKSK